MGDKNWIFAVDRHHQSIDVGNRRYYNRYGADRKQQLSINGASTTMIRPKTYQSNYSMRPQSYTSNGGYHHQRPTSTLLSTAQQQAQQRLQSINRLNDRIASNRQFVSSALPPQPPTRITSIQQKRRSIIDNDSHHLNIANNDIDSHRHHRIKQQQQPSSEYNRKSIMNEFDAAFDRFANRIVDESFDFINVELNKDKVNKDVSGKMPTITVDRSNHNYIQRSNVLPTTAMITNDREQLDRQKNLKKSIRKKKRRIIEHRDENGEIDAVYEEQENQIDIAAEEDDEVDEDSGNSTPTKPPPPPPTPSSTTNVRPATPQLRRTYLTIPIDIPIVHQRSSEQLQSKCVNFRDQKKLLSVGGNTTDDAYGSMDSFGELPSRQHRSPTDVGSTMLARNSCYYDRCDVCSAAGAGDNVVHAICPVCRCVQHCQSNMGYVIDDGDDVTLNIDMNIDTSSPSIHHNVTQSIEPYYGNHAMVVADRHHNYRTYQPPRTSIVEYPSPSISQYGNGSLNRSSNVQHLSAEKLVSTVRKPIINYSELSTSPMFNGVLLQQKYGDRTLFRVADDSNHKYYQQQATNTDLIVDYDLVVQKHRRSRANIKRNRRCIALAVCLIAMTILIVVAIVLAVNYNC